MLCVDTGKFGNLFVYTATGYAKLKRDTPTTSVRVTTESNRPST